MLHVTNSSGAGLGASADLTFRIWMFHQLEAGTEINNVFALSLSPVGQGDARPPRSELRGERAPETRAPEIGGFAGARCTG